MNPYRHGSFLNLEPGLCDPERSGAAILPLPLDLTASWKRGTAEGPVAIIEASSHIERFDDELGFDACEAAGGIHTCSYPDLPTDPRAADEAIESLAASLLRPQRLLISLGGEHSVTFPLVRAHRHRWPGLCVLQIDAHADLRDTYHGSPLNHACPMRRIVELGVHVTAVGIRSADESERPLLESDLHRTFHAGRVAGRLAEHTGPIIESLPAEEVYVTIDLDGLDPSVVPAVGTPVPGGLGWYETLALLKAVAAEKHVVGADVVELCPQPGLHHADSAAARLVYKLIAYRTRAAGN